MSIQATVDVDPAQLPSLKTGTKPSAVELFYSTADGWSSKVTQRTDASIFAVPNTGIERWSVWAGDDGAATINNVELTANLAVGARYTDAAGNASEAYGQGPGKDWTVTEA